MMLRTFFSGALMFGFAAFAGCGSSDSDPDASAGTGGALAGQGGSAAGSAGSGGTAGTGGSAGSGGTAGTGGGASGGAGSGVGGAGTGGGAGSGGTAGTDGFGEPPVASDMLCGERPGRVSNEVEVLRFETADGSTTVQLRRVYDGVGVGESSVYHIETFAVVREGVTACIDDASLKYTNSHHNWSDVAEAESGGVHYRLEFTFLDSAGYQLIGTANGATLFEEPLIVTGAPHYCWSCPAGVQAAISELMVNNVATYADEAGEFEPWIELYNPSAEERPLAGYTLSNDFGDRGRWALPSVSIPPLQTLVIFADGEPADGPLHTNFRLSPNGGEVVLTRPDGVTDGGFVYGSMPADASLAYEWIANDYVRTRQPTPNEPPADTF